MVPGPVLTARDVPPPVGGTQAGLKPRTDGGALHPRPTVSTLRDARAEFEREFITQKLREFGGNVSRTADAIDVERSNLHRKIKALGIEAED
jgi:two-component system nitrogen regulation response regulator NtrX